MIAQFLVSCTIFFTLAKCESSETEVVAKPRFYIEGDSYTINLIPFFIALKIAFVLGKLILYGLPKIKLEIRYKLALETREILIRSKKVHYTLSWLIHLYRIIAKHKIAQQKFFFNLGCRMYVQYQLQNRKKYANYCNPLNI